MQHDNNEMQNQGAVGETVALEFTGSGTEYFRIWIVNLALTVLTLGIYSAWAKVRRLQYFHRNTKLAGSGFDYHGEPLAILKGRIVGVLLLGGYSVMDQVSVLAQVAMFVLIMVVMPWLAVRSLKFRLHYTSYRGLRFAFDGTTKQAYKNFLLWPLFSYISLGLLAPYAHREIKQFQHGSSRFGNTPFSFNATPNSFYKLYFKAFLLMLVTFAVAIGVVFTVGNMIPASFAGLNNETMDKDQLESIGMLVGFIAAFIFILPFMLLLPWFQARIQNLVWSHTALGESRLFSHVRARDLLGLYLGNFIAIVLTLGLFKPFADIRLARYRLERMGLQDAKLDSIIGQADGPVGAVAEETAELFDFDFSL